MGQARLQVVLDWSDTEGRGGYRWRLLGGNNRPLARSPQAHPDESQCLLDAQGASALMETTTRLVGTAGAWRWTVSRGQEVVAESCRSYLRRCEAEGAAGLFCELAPQALAGSTAHVGSTFTTRSSAS